MFTITNFIQSSIRLAMRYYTIKPQESCSQLSFIGSEEKLIARNDSFQKKEMLIQLENFQVKYG